MNESAIIHQHRMIGSEYHHVCHRYESGEIDLAEYEEIDKHLSEEMYRLKCLYRGRQWPVVESEERK